MNLIKTPSSHSKKKFESVADIITAFDQLKNLLYVAKEKGSIDPKICKQLYEKYLTHLEMIVMEATISYNKIEKILFEVNKYEHLLEINFNNHMSTSEEQRLLTEYKNQFLAKAETEQQNLRNSIEFFALHFSKTQNELFKHLKILIEKKQEYFNKEAILIINENVHQAKERFQKMISSDEMSMKGIVTKSDLPKSEKENILERLYLFEQEIEQHAYQDAIISAKDLIDLCKSIHGSTNTTVMLGVIYSTLSVYYSALTQWVRFDQGEIDYKNVISENIADKSAELLQKAEFNEKFFTHYATENKNSISAQTSEKSKLAEKCNILFRKIKEHISENKYKTDADIERDIYAMEALTKEYGKLLEKEQAHTLESKEQDEFSLHLKREFSQLRKNLELLRSALAHLHNFNSE